MAMCTFSTALGYLDVRVADTDYGSFAVVYIYKELEGALSTMVQLYSRTQDASPQALKAFQDFYPTVGLQDDMMVMLPKSGARRGREGLLAPCWGAGGQGSTLATPESHPSPAQAGDRVSSPGPPPAAPGPRFLSPLRPAVAGSREPGALMQEGFGEASSDQSHLLLSGGFGNTWGGDSGLLVSLAPSSRASPWHWEAAVVPGGTSSLRPPGQGSPQQQTSPPQVWTWSEPTALGPPRAVPHPPSLPPLIWGLFPPNKQILQPLGSSLFGESWGGHRRPISSPALLAAQGGEEVGRQHSQGEWGTSARPCGSWAYGMVRHPVTTGPGHGLCWVGVAADREVGLAWVSLLTVVIGGTWPNPLRAPEMGQCHEQHNSTLLDLSWLAGLLAP
ncbi:Hypothetical predicted protein [Marmota monax]|uniref:Lipocalin/cytosolic fatty-acid binding domain-containing protein n=1 Tax=Marmota monax TaxID=9995 RepID=A0A5E4AC60_MARMO|nr:Hypothetical predicted protein [Marmota monax]